MNLPIVGLTTYRQEARWGNWARPAALVQTSYLDTVAQAGGYPVLVPPVATGHDPVLPASALVEMLDALVLIGGEDVGDNPVRDAWEGALVSAALDQDLPLLAICRGVQLLNVHLGGTLIRDLNSEGFDGHRSAPGQFSNVTIEAGAGTRVAAMMGERFEVKCSHHQAIDRLGDGLEVTARAADRVVEAVELIPGITVEEIGPVVGTFVVGVQWHPEEDGDTRLFGALVAAAVKEPARVPVKPETVKRTMGELFSQREAGRS